MITENLSTLKIHKLTQAQYNRELVAGRIDETALYLTPEEAINLSEYITINEANNTYETKSDASLKLDKSKTYTDEQIALIKEYADGLVNGEISLDHSHDDKYYTEEEIDIKFDEINTSISNKVDSNHNHDDAYDEKGAANTALDSAQVYTNNAISTVKTELLDGAKTEHNTLNKIGILIEGNKSEIEELKKAISGKADATHNHDDSYDAKGSADTALESAKTYSDEGIAKLLNNSTDAVDSIYELRDAMQENADAIDALNSIAAGKANKDHSHDDRYYTEEEIDTKLSAINTSITNITSGTTIVEKAAYATNASSAETANTASSAETATNAINSVNATKATQDASGNVITTTYETKSDAESKLNQAKAYTDDKVKDLVSTIDMSNAINKAKSEAVADAKAETDTQVNALANNQVKTNTDAISAIKDDSNIDSFADVVAELTKKQNAGDYATKSEVKEVSDSFSEYKNTHINDYTNSQIDEKIKTVSDNVSKLDETYATDKELSDAIKAEVNRSNEAYAAKSVEDSKLDVNTFNQHEVLFDAHVGDATHVNSTEKDNWNEAKAHADSLHAPTNAQANVIEEIKVNGSKVTPTNKSINITVPTDYLTSAHTQNHAPNNAQENVIESIMVGDTAMTVSEKAVNITGAVTSIVSDNLTSNRVLISDNSGKVAISAINTTKLGYLSGVTSDIQSQLDKKMDEHNHPYAGSSTEGGAANSANKLNTNAGGAKIPVYFAEGVPVAFSDTVGSSNTPMYMNAGELTACSQYAGGTAVTLNSSSKSASTASFFAPTDGGTNGYILKSSGASAAPTWVQAVPVANGGTGATTAKDARTNLGVYSIEDVDGALDTKMDKTNPIGTGSFSLNRKANTTVGANSVAEGYNTTASGSYSHAEGYNTTASGEYSHAEGRGTTASGDSSHAEGYVTTASGDYSHASGFHTTASGGYSYANGESSTASGNYSHAEGNNTEASGNYSYARGLGTKAVAKSMTAIGEYNKYEEKSSYCETTTNKSLIGSESSRIYYFNGVTISDNEITYDSYIQKSYASIKSGDYFYQSNNVSNTIYQCTDVYYNDRTYMVTIYYTQYRIIDQSINHGLDILVIGNGTSDTARSNAHTLDWSGNAWFAGDIYIGSTSGTDKDDGSKKVATIDDITAAIGNAIAASY